MQDDWTALHYVSENGLIDVVVLFTQRGANINAITKVCCLKSN